MEALGALTVSVQMRAPVRTPPGARSGNATAHVILRARSASSVRLHTSPPTENARRAVLSTLVASHHLGTAFQWACRGGVTAWRPTRETTVRLASASMVANAFLQKRLVRNLDLLTVNVPWAVLWVTTVSALP